jgi:uncharacterized protein YidB (DUF937 family)
LERFNQNGHGDVANSWIAQGPNQEISPPQLKQAIGPDVLDKLEQQTGLSRDEILARLSRELPAAVDKYTPDGRMPAAQFAMLERYCDEHSLDDCHRLHCWCPSQIHHAG